MTEHTVRQGTYYTSRNNRKSVKVRNSSSNTERARFAVLFESEDNPQLGELDPGQERGYTPTYVSGISWHRPPAAGKVTVTNTGPVSIKVTTY